MKMRKKEPTQGPIAQGLDIHVRDGSEWFFATFDEWGSQPTIAIVSNTNTETAKPPVTVNGATGG
jgi:hypothetical protein